MGIAPKMIHRPWKSVLMFRKSLLPIYLLLPIATVLAACEDVVLTDTPYNSADAANPALQVGVYRVDIIDPVLKAVVEREVKEVQIIRQGNTYVEVSTEPLLPGHSSIKRFALFKFKNNLYVSTSLDACEGSHHCNDLVLISENGKVAYSWALRCHLLEYEFRVDLAEILAVDERETCKFTKPQLKKVFEVLTKTIGSLDPELQPYSAAIKFTWVRSIQ